MVERCTFMELAMVSSCFDFKNYKKFKKSSKVLNFNKRVYDYFLSTIKENFNCKFHSIYAHH